jgi:hypothetical protein
LLRISITYNFSAFLAFRKKPLIWLFGISKSGPGKLKIDFQISSQTKTCHLKALSIA